MRKLRLGEEAALTFPKHLTLLPSQLTPGWELRLGFGLLVPLPAALVRASEEGRLRSSFLAQSSLSFPRVGARSAFPGRSLPGVGVLHSAPMRGSLSDLRSLCPQPWEDAEGRVQDLMGGRSQGWEGQPAQEPTIQASESQMRSPKTSAYTPVPPHLAAKRKRHKTRNPLTVCQELYQPPGSSLDSQVCFYHIPLREDPCHSPDHLSQVAELVRGSAGSRQLAPACFLPS